MSPTNTKIANIALAGSYALTITVGAIGEWNYYMLGSAMEVALLAVIVNSPGPGPDKPHQPPLPN